MPSYQMPHCRRQCEACHTSHVLTSVQGAPKAASAPSAPSDLAASSSILNFQHRSGAMARMRAVGAVATATVLASACLALLPLLASAGCPFKLGLNVGPRDALDEPLLLQRRELLAAAVDQVAAMAALDVAAVKADIRKLLTDSKSIWPADFDNYGPFMIRNAWHSAGSYRTWDGRGGADGARMRFLPELAWEDNTNLDKARKLLAPLKEKYGAALSWGDLTVLTGDIAIESMGGPSVGSCLGRIDDTSGVKSEALGPTPLQRMVAPCVPGDGNCENPLGATTMGLIYVNPEGVLGDPVPKKSVPQIRETFARMAMNDSETVALIGGGHAFGKTHGACPTGAGPGPLEDPANPWPGTCGSGPLKGKGPNTFTSGFEGSWTTRPTTWTNSYFKNLLRLDWEKHKGPGGHWQWKPKYKANATAAEKADPLPDIMMLTTDIALLEDPKYLELVKLYANDLDALTRDFGSAWYKLMNRDQGPATRCLHKNLVPANHDQLVLGDTLPPPPAQPANYAVARAEIAKALTAPSKAAPGDSSNGKPYYGALFATLAFQCAASYRDTDKAGGCNGARIRFAPDKDWAENKDLDKVLAVLKPIKDARPNLTWADLIVLAGTVANEQAAGGAAKFPFCSGRSDAADGRGHPSFLAPRSYTSVAIAVADNLRVAGLTVPEGVALAGGLRSPAHQKALGYSGSWSSQPDRLSNEFFKVLLANTWEPTKSASGKDEFKAKGKAGVFITPADHVLLSEPYLAVVKQYAADNAKFLRDFSAAWTRRMNADRFRGPAGNTCAST